MSWAQFSGFGSGASFNGQESRIGRGGVGIRPFASVSTTYDQSVGAAKLNSAGGYELRPSYGVEGAFGLYGTKNWKRTGVGLNFRGDSVHYTSLGSLNSSNLALSMMVSHQFNRSWAFQSNIAAGSTDRVLGALQSFVPFDSNFLNVPNNEVVNSRANYGEVSAHVIYQRSSRLSVNFGGSTLVTRRANRGLAELNGFTGDVSIGYMFSKRTSLSANYQFNHFQFLGTFGASDIHGGTLNLSRRISRDWKARVGVQGNRMESLGSVRVQLDPLIALLLGRTSGTEAYYRVNFIPGFSAGVDYAHKRTFISISAQQGVSPGNGIYLTSKQSSGGVQISHTAERVWNFGVNAGYTQYGSLTRTLQIYKSFLVGAGVTRQLRFLNSHAFARVDHRNFSQGDLTSLNQNGLRVSFGVGFSPGAIPLSLW